jgi:hypothetical protein
MAQFRRGIDQGLTRPKHEPKATAKAAAIAFGIGPTAACVNFKSAYEPTAEWAAATGDWRARLHSSAHTENPTRVCTPVGHPDHQHLPPVLQAVHEREQGGHHARVDLVGAAGARGARGREGVELVQEYDAGGRLRGLGGVGARGRARACRRGGCGWGRVRTRSRARGCGGRG